MTRPDLLSSFAPVAVTSRSDLDESVHFGAVVVLDGTGEVVLAVGDPDVIVYARSSMKPLQADAMLRLGFVGSDEQLALACASHDGTPAHVAVVRSILADAGLDATALGNTPDWPLDPDEAEALIASGEQRAPLYMNCSGKHAAMVATCVRNGWPLDSYLAPDHPLQAAITGHVVSLAGPVAHIGVDGCGAPAHAMSLRGLADAIRSIAASEGPVWGAMSRHPTLVGGARRVSAKLVAQAPGFLAKEGAEGMFVAARPGGPTVAVKIADGGGRAAGVVAVSALRRVGVDVDPAPIAPPILGHGQPVGAVRALLPEAP